MPHPLTRCRPAWSRVSAWSAYGASLSRGDNRLPHGPQTQADEYGQSNQGNENCPRLGASAMLLGVLVDPHLTGPQRIAAVLVLPRSTSLAPIATSPNPSPSKSAVARPLIVPRVGCPERKSRTRRTGCRVRHRTRRRSPTTARSGTASSGQTATVAATTTATTRRRRGDERPSASRGCQITR